VNKKKNKKMIKQEIQKVVERQKIELIELRQEREKEETRMKIYSKTSSYYGRENDYYEERRRGH